ncbi:RGS1-HXK1-interacting protein 1 isoform X3 [Hordeum vulgare subsp. vulgare]|uniref:RGS1-HXK1-interacting protein 1 isoform X3 n=1 Tax=Hordeum vulgare subsp. vulgare TaxID=112509 RepID=UPI001D1A5407|nr:RGS1-HXK1-interacting protein 1 isoform X3 [Hordeum vulgare subsp. vulgare]
MASSDTGRTPAQGAEAASASSWPLRKLQSFTPGLWSQYKAYEDVFVERAKGPRRFLYRNTLGRFKTEKDLLNDVEQSMIEYKTSIESLRKDSKYTLDKVVIGESDLQRGRTDLRSTGKQIQSVISSIYKAESTAAGIEFFFKGLMDRLRIIPTRQSLELRAEVASMASDLKNQRHVLEERVNRISEYGVRV